jgi:hypothetical protein
MRRSFGAVEVAMCDAAEERWLSRKAQRDLYVLYVYGR